VDSLQEESFGGWVLLGALLRFEVEVVGDQVNYTRIFVCLFVCCQRIAHPGGDLLAKNMCGIFAYINCHVPRERRHILEVLFNGLRRLEYRGYDSAGISIDADNDDHLEEVKKKGLGLGGEGARQLSPPLVFREEGKIEKLVTSVYQGNGELGLLLLRCFADFLYREISLFVLLNP
jgi:hypothetical protein